MYVINTEACLSGMDTLTPICIHSQTASISWYVTLLEKEYYRYLNMYRHDFMCFQRFRGKNNPSWVNPCEIRKSHPRGWIFWSGTQQVSYSPQTLLMASFILTCCTPHLFHRRRWRPSRALAGCRTVPEPLWTAGCHSAVWWSSSGSWQWRSRTVAVGDSTPGLTVLPLDKQVILIHVIEIKII